MVSHKTQHNILNWADLGRLQTDATIFQEIAGKHGTDLQHLGASNSEVLLSFNHCAVDEKRKAKPEQAVDEQHHALNEWE